MLSFLLERLYNPDEWLFWLINERLTAPPLDVFFSYITDAAYYNQPLIIGAVVLLIFSRKKGVAVILLATISVILDEWAGSKLLKNLIARQRPCQVLDEFNMLIGCSKTFSFPSGHATNSFSIAIIMIRFYRWYAAPVLAFAALVAYSRVYVGVHYPSDVVAGALLGSAMSFALYYAAGKVLELIWRPKKLFAQNARDQNWP